MTSNFLTRIRFQHAFTFQPNSPRNMLQAASWRFLSELALRHPGLFQIQTDSYPTGQPMIWAFHKVSKLKIGVVEGSSITVFNPDHRSHCPVCDAIPEEENSRLHVLDLLHVEDLDWPMRELETCMGLRAGDPNPSLQPESVAHAVIRDMFWHARNTGLKLHTKSPAGFGEKELFEFLRKFPDAPSSRKGVIPDRTNWERFEEEMRDSMTNIIMVEGNHQARQEIYEMVFDLDSGFYFDRSGGFQLMDELNAGGKVSDIAYGLLES